jgi:hypothetical protein
MYSHVILLLFFQHLGLLAFMSVMLFVAGILGYVLLSEVS